MISDHGTTCAIPPNTTPFRRYLYLPPDAPSFHCACGHGVLHHRFPCFCPWLILPPCRLCVVLAANIVKCYCVNNGLNYDDGLKTVFCLLCCKRRLHHNHHQTPSQNLPPRNDLKVALFYNLSAEEAVTAILTQSSHQRFLLALEPASKSTI